MPSDLASSISECPPTIPHKQEGRKYHSPCRQGNLNLLCRCTDLHFFLRGQRALRNWLVPNNAVIQPKNRERKVPYFSFVLKTTSELGALEQRRPLMHQHLPITLCWVCMRNPALMLSTKRNSPADNQINCYISRRPSFRRYGDGLPLNNFCSGIAPT